jgi:hypothetical protein
MIARVLKAIAWSALFGFVVGACTYAFATLINLMYGPVFYTTRGPVEHLGGALIYGLGGLAILGAAFALSYLVWLRDRPALAAVLPLAVVAFIVQCLELGAIESLAIRESNALSWPISDQLIPLNVAIFRQVGNWEGRPDAAFVWFSAGVVAFAFAAWRSRSGRSR